MNGHIPHRGLYHPISGAAGKAHKFWHALVVAPEAHLQQAEFQGLAHAAHRPPAPAHRITQALELHQIDGPLGAQHQADLGVWGGANPVLLPVETG